MHVACMTDMQLTAAYHLLRLLGTTCSSNTRKKEKKQIGHHARLC